MTPAPQPTHRLIPSCFPPIGLFDTVATAADLAAVMELAGWTNDRLVAERIARLPRDEWVYGVPNASVVMAAFLHAAPDGMRFNGPDLGAWYAAASLATTAAEVGHHLRREAVARGLADMRRVYRGYTACLTGAYHDLRGARSARPDLYAPASYAAGQVYGEAVRASAPGGIVPAGIVYDSVRHNAGVNVVCYRPRAVTELVQSGHFEITIAATGRRIEVRRLA